MISDVTITVIFQTIKNGFVLQKVAFVVSMILVMESYILGAII